MTTALDIYRKTLTSLDETDTAWWYLGTTTAEVDDGPAIVVNHVETVMIYRARTLGPDGYRVPWWEIGVFRDAITGEVASTWTNPLTGATIDHPRVFEEGPSGYSIIADGEGVVMRDAVQAFAALDSATIAIDRVGDRLRVTQTELKTRSFPAKDGIPDLAAGQGSRSKTVLQWYADAGAAMSDARSIPATGVYSLDIAAPAWLGFGDRPTRFRVVGLMVKADLAPPLNPRGWADLQTVFPQYFVGGEITPRWA